jgi:hypothetical protein
MSFLVKPTPTPFFTGQDVVRKFQEFWKRALEIQETKVVGMRVLLSTPPGSRKPPPLGVGLFTSVVAAREMGHIQFGDWSNRVER